MIRSRQLCFVDAKFCRIHRAAVLVFLAILLIAATPGWAQVTSTIAGRVVDPSGSALPDANILVTNPELAIQRTVTTDANGEFRIPGLLSGIYRIEVRKQGFETRVVEHVELTVNQTLSTKLAMQLASVKTEVAVTDMVPLLETETSSTGATVTPEQINTMPLNGRNYLDLMQLVPGVTVNRQADQGTDSSTPVLGQRGNNAQFLIDGMPNTDNVNGGAAAQFNQDSILEFQVLTSGYKAEFGYGSGGIVNVVSKSGTNNWHGLGSVFYRNWHLDSSDIPSQPDPPFLQRWDPSFQVGGPVVKDRVFIFNSIERIMESRQLNFQFPPDTPDFLIQEETPFNRHTLTNDTRIRSKIDEQVGSHRFSEQINLTNSHINDYLPLSAGNINLPSTRYNVSSRHLMLGFTDDATFGQKDNPYLLNYYLQYREEPSTTTPTHPEAGINTQDNLFPSLDTGELFAPQVQYGSGFNALPLHQKYWSAGLNIARIFRAHTIKAGWNFQRMMTDGSEASNYFNQLFGLESDLASYGPTGSGVYYLNVQGGLTPAASRIRLRNNYDGLYLQDDWKLARKLTVNLGVRWDYDSTFPVSTNVSPRLGAAWQVTSKTVVRASFGRFYDHFRLGLARDIPGFGGADITRQLYLSFPRLFYGNPSIITPFFVSVGRDVPCVSSNMTDAQVASSGASCGVPGVPFWGIDHLNSVVAAGHTPVPAGAMVDESNVQQLTGLTPDQYLATASAAVGKSDGYFSWDPFGHLSVHNSLAQYNIPITVDPGFKTPYTDTFHFGVQHQLTDTIAISADYYHENIANGLGVRETNLAFEARLPEFTGELVPGTGDHLVNSYGPWYSGFYDGVTVQLTKRMSHHFQFEASYSYAKEWDNMLNSSFVSDLQTGSGAAYTVLNGPSDSFRGIVPVVTDSTTGQTNATSAFVTSTGNPVSKAGTYYNGANLDYGPSDLSVPHVFLLYGIVQLPYGFEFSDIFRAQSGFAYTRGSTTPPDVDGDGIYGGRDITFLRNGFRAPKSVNMDFRVAKDFHLSERISAHAYFEMFNLFNNANPAAVESLPDQLTPFGGLLQRLPGREGQVGFRIEF